MYILIALNSYLKNYVADKTIFLSKQKKSVCIYIYIYILYILNFKFLIKSLGSGKTGAQWLVIIN